MEHLKEVVCMFRQENVRLRSHLLVHIKLVRQEAEFQIA